MQTAAPSRSSYCPVLSDQKNPTSPVRPSSKAMGTTAAACRGHQRVNVLIYLAAHARMIAALARRHGLRPVDRAGTALMIEHAARLADHANKLTLVVDQLDDVLAEADFWAGKAGRSTISRADVESAIEQKIRRSSRLRDRAQESILQDVALIDTSGARIGQVNGLSVAELAGFRRLQ